MKNQNMHKIPQFYIMESTDLGQLGGAVVSTAA